MRPAVAKPKGVRAGASLLVLLVAAWPELCGAGPSASVTWNLAQKVDFRTHEQLTCGEYGQAVVLVVGSAEAWDREMQRLRDTGALLYGSARRGAELGVDWNRHSLLLVACGERPTSPCRLTVREVRRLGLRLIVDVSLEADPMGTQSACAPYHMVLVRKANWTSAAFLHAPGDCADWSAPRGRRGGARDVSASGGTSSRAPVSREVSWSKLRARYR